MKKPYITLKHSLPKRRVSKMLANTNAKAPSCKGPQLLPGALIRACDWQEREDSNPRPLVLETSALARLSYAPAMGCASRDWRLMLMVPLEGSYFKRGRRGF